MNQNEKEMSFKEEILYLISLKQEGGYWDFKRQWYENKNDLLHDIICMANNLHNRTAYIIIGIDEKQDWAVVDVKDDPNRRNTQNIVDFLKDKKFAGGIRPLVHVEQIAFSDREIDVIVIENSHNTPFYLTSRVESLCANYIYTRVMDTNTPVNSSADINNVEYLWRKRFRLDTLPIEKFAYYLENPDDWSIMQDIDMGYFYKPFPEFTIICEKDEYLNGYEYYVFGHPDTRPSWWNITLKYHQTAIEQFLGLYLDGGRSFVVAPQRAHGLINTGISAVGYFIKNSLRYQLLKFFYRKVTVEKRTYETFLEVVAVLESEYEYQEFLRYLKRNRAYYDKLCAQSMALPYFPELNGYIMDGFKKDYKDALIINDMLEEFRGGID